MSPPTERDNTIRNNMNEEGSSSETPTATEQTRRDTSSPQKEQATVNDLIYGISSFDAVVKPVFVTMVLAALATIYISTPDSRAEGEQSLSNSYTVLQGSEEDTDGQKLGQSLVNGLVIVLVITVMTFVIVLLYKYRCMKILVGYMIVAMTSLLGFVSSEMFSIAIERYELGIDRVSYAITIYNFALVGTIALFFGQGIPAYISQCYLIAISVIVAWQLSHFDPWTAWVLLVLLALYDLFAVLSPCGPLKALVNLMSQSDAPHLPGLLYEANLNMGQQQSNRARTTEQSSDRNSYSQMNGAENATSTSATTTASSTDETNNGQTSLSAAHPQNDNNATPMQSSSTGPSEEKKSDSVDEGDADEGRVLCGKIPLGLAIGCNISLVSGQDTTNAYRPEELQAEVEYEGQPLRYDVLDTDNNLLKVLFMNREGRVMEDRSHLRQTGTIPLAMARLNKLRLVHGPQPSWIRRAENPSQADDILDENWTPEELQRDVEVIFPTGWQIVIHVEQRDNEPTRYAVIKPNGSLKRIIFVNREENDKKAERGSIRLGLGDFIFYSILVSKAALYSFTTFAACVPAVLLGLALTLGILAYHGKALPALPISIFLGVAFYFITRYSVQPWVEDIFIQAVYV